MNRINPIITVFWLAVATAHAVGPHELLVLVNRASKDSKAVASEFVKLRQIPAQNVVYLDLGSSVSIDPPKMTVDEFIKLIRDPAVSAMKERGIDDHILAWIYSVDFPTRVDTDHKMSIQGITFTKGEVPKVIDIKRGLYKSALFGGPDRPGGVAHYSQTFDFSRESLRGDMPVPSMLLGYSGNRGNSVQMIRDYLKKGVLSDGTSPSGTVYFVKSDDIRSTCREWEYEAAVVELARYGVEARIVKRFPDTGQKIIGLTAGLARVTPANSGSYLPGCMAEHLTSMGGVFHAAGQTKLSAWLESGATASTGTATEPYALWTKFPHARFYVHYAAGCTMIESFYQSLRCPLQILLVGEPLACPWGDLDATLEIDGLAEKLSSGKVFLAARVKGKEARRYRRFTCLLDGKIVAKDSEFWLDVERLNEGEHRFRVVARSTGFVSQQVFTEKIFTVSDKSQGE
jgi:uncharacterized protein (TIGR03790 family)